MFEQKWFKFVIGLFVPLGLFLRTTDANPPYSRIPFLISRIMPTFFIFWLFSFIPAAGGAVYYLCFVTLSAYIHIKEKKIRNKQQKAEILLRYYAVIIVGFGGIWGFIGHTFLAELVAKSIGWIPSPFQAELAFYHLGLAITALLSIWMKKDALVPIVIAKSIFWYGAAIVHINDLLVYNNTAIGNIGGPLVGDLIFPTIMLLLLAATHSNKEKNEYRNKF